MRVIFFIFLSILPVVVFGQPTTENYISTTVYTIPVSIITQSSASNDEKIEAVTYFDGLGRSKQQIQQRAGGAREDLITPLEYDALGRKPKSYLPYPLLSNDGNYYEGSNGNIILDLKTFYKTKFPDDFYQPPGHVPDWDNPFTEKIFEASPLNRVLKLGAPGMDWNANYGGQHTIDFEYATNTANEVEDYSVTFQGGNTSLPQLEYNGAHSSHTLFKTVTKDENWQSGNNNTVQEFTNKIGQILLKRSFSGSVAHDTNYVYDDFGNLTFVLSPEGSENILNGSSIDLQVLDNLCYQYKYDKRNRLIEKKTPGKGWEYIFYDNLDRSILSQDAMMRAENSSKFLFTKYDCYGRVAFTGIYISPFGTRSSIEGAINGISVCGESQSTTSTSIAGTNVYYSNSAFPYVGIDKVHTVNYYDDYVDTNGVSIPSSTFGVNAASDVAGLPTVSKVRVLETDDWITTIMTYDDKERVLWSHTENDYLQTTDIVRNKVEFSGRVSEVFTTHTKTGFSTISIRDYYIYDHMGRLYLHEQKIDNSQIQLIAQNEYDELGQLVKKNVGGETYLSGYSDMENVDASFEGIVEKTGGTNIWDAGLKTRGEIIGTGAITFEVVTSDKELKVGLNKTSENSLDYDFIRYGIHLTTENASGGGKKVKYIKNGTSYYPNPEVAYVPGDVFKVEHLTNAGLYVEYSKNGATPFHTESGVQDNLVGKAVFNHVGGKIDEFHLTGNIDKRLQNVDYTYNVRGWLTNINDVEPSFEEPTIPDLFNFKITYNNVETNTNSTALFNGNIAQTFWSTNNTDTDIRGYNYNYDGLNRINSATSIKGTYLVSMSEAGIQHNLSNLGYDKNGNILSLMRYGDNENSGFALWDNLSYSYNGNQLSRVIDNSTSSSTMSIKGFPATVGNNTANYAYDENGNMITDDIKGITDIEYNHLNLPRKITFDNLDPEAISGSKKGLIYIYDATGVKLEKKLFNFSNPVVTTEYASNFIYEDQVGTNELQFFNHPEGYTKQVINIPESNKGYDEGTGGEIWSSYHYTFQYKDHLGNIRLSYQDINLNGAIDPLDEIVEENHYYPFGLKQLGYNDVVQGGNDLAQQWKFGGKQYDESLGLDTYDFGARNYDPALGRWMNVDPLAEMSYNLTPYRFAGNNPILFQDPNGLWEFIFDSDAGTLSLNRQEGDTYDSFLEQSGLSAGQARKLFGVSKKELKSKLNEGGGDSFGVSDFNSKSKIGNMLQGMEEALTTGNVELSQNPSNDMSDAINNCWNCTINLTSDGRVDSNALTQPDTIESLFTSMLNGTNFDNKLGSDYRNVSNPRTGDAIRYSADGGNTTTHGSVFLLQNDNGVQIFTKNGFANGQLFQIMTQNQLIQTYSNYGEAKGKQNYTTQTTGADGKTQTVTRSDSSPFYRKN